jgi:hypothetical protein
MAWFLRERSETTSAKGRSQGISGSAEAGEGDVPPRFLSNDAAVFFEFATDKDQVTIKGPQGERMFAKEK